MSESLEFGLKGALQKMRGSDEEGKIQFVILYGSAAEGKEGELSDIDLAAGYDGSKGERFDFRVRYWETFQTNSTFRYFKTSPST